LLQKADDLLVGISLLHVRPLGVTDST
jgi:hypothetical protein